MSKWPEKFDIVVANPPYSKKLDLKFLDKSFDVCKGELVFVHPATAFIERKGVTRIYSDVVSKIKKDIDSITLFNGNGVFGIGLFVPCSITKIYKGKNAKGFTLNNLLYNDSKWVPTERIKDVNFFGYDDRFISIDEKISPSNSLYENTIKNEEESFNVYVQISKISGHTWVGGRSKDIKMNSPIVQPDFFEIIKKSTKITETRDSIYVKHTWGFNTKTEAENFIKYCKTSFARMCMSLNKINQNVQKIELSKIPWMDFTQEWNDEKLYAHFNISEEEQEFIRSVIPSYY